MRTSNLQGSSQDSIPEKGLTTEESERSITNEGESETQDPRVASETSKRFETGDPVKKTKYKNGHEVLGREKLIQK